MIVAILLFAKVPHAQEAITGSLLLLEEFHIVYSDDLTARLDNLVTQIYDNPNLKILIVVHRAENELPGFPYRYGAKLKTNMIQRLGVEQNRIFVVNGETRTERTIQISMTTTIPETPLPKNEIVNGLFDRYSYDSPNDLGSCCSIDDHETEEAQASLDAFAESAKKDSTKLIYLIAYSQYLAVGLPFILRDKPVIAQKLVRQERRYLIEKHGIEKSRFVMIDGGFRDYRTVELYLVAKDAKKPKADPTTFPPPLKTKKKKRTTK